MNCFCSVCQSSNSKNQRTRASIFISTARGKKFLIDTSPDLRMQYLKNKLSPPDGVFITHDHADHLHGIDDLRPFSFRQKAMDLYTSTETANLIKERFSYIFAQKNQKVGGGIPLIDMHEVSIGEEEIIEESESFLFYLLPHHHTKTLGIVHEKKMAYFIDCNSIPTKTLNALKSFNLELLIIDCVRRAPHQTHLNLDKALQYANEIQAKKTVFTHLSHDFDHQELSNELKKYDSTFFPAYDGQLISY